MKIVMGDMNAKVGTDNTGREGVMGRHGARAEMNENGEKWTDFCQANELVMGGTLFPHKERHKRTWMSPDGGTENQIMWHSARDGGARCRTFAPCVGRTLGLITTC